MSTHSGNRPNVIFVLTDQQRWDSTGVHGNPLDVTPNFDRMAQTGTHVARAFSPQPVCGPARAALQTGLTQTQTGCHRNAKPLPTESRTLAHYFNDEGYHTGYIGKWHLAKSQPVAPEERGGYQSWLASNVLEFTSDAYHTIVYDDDNNAVGLPGYRSDALFDAAIRYVADRADPTGGTAEPFFLFVSLIEPHHQNELDNYPAPIGYAERYNGRWLPPDLAALTSETTTAYQHIGGYLGQIRRIDEGLGRLNEALHSLGLDNETIVVFTSDHGNHFKTRNSEYKRSCHDGSIHVPLALTGPGFDGGGLVNKPVSTLDLPPTLLHAAGIPVPTHFQGRAIQPLVADPEADWPEGVLIQISETEVGRAYRTARWLYHITAPNTDPWDDAASDHYVETSLYDLDTDPYQLDNLIGLSSHRALADRLRDLLLDRMVEVGEQRPHVEPAPERPAGQRRIDPMVHGLSAPSRFGHQPSQL